MNFKFPLWTLIVALLLFFPIAYSGINWLGIFPASYLLFVLFTISFNVIKIKIVSFWHSLVNLFRKK